MQGLDLFDSGALDLSDWDQRLPPPAAKTAVQTLTVVIISAEQAGDRPDQLKSSYTQNNQDILLVKAHLKNTTPFTCDLGLICFKEGTSLIRSVKK